MRLPRASRQFLTGSWAFRFTAEVDEKENEKGPSCLRSGRQPMKCLLYIPVHLENVLFRPSKQRNLLALHPEEVES